MKSLLLSGLILMSLTVEARDKDRDDHQKHQDGKGKHHKVHQGFEVVPLNSPVKTSTANFLLKTPSGVEIEKVSYRIKNAHHLFDKSNRFDPVKLVEGPQGKELQVPVSKLPPGFYQLFVKVMDKKSKREHDCRGKLKDHAMFVIDSSLRVAVPNEKENNKTLAGIDTNNDGIRDDIERWIQETFSSRPKVLMGIRQFAVASQLRLLSVGEKNSSILTTKNSLDAATCLDSIVDVEESAILTNQLNTKLLNTKSRLDANIQGSSNFNGQIYDFPNRGDEKNLCTFNPDEF